MSGNILQIFDPAMCCSSGVCGPEVDPARIRLAGDLKWLQSQGVAVERFNLAQTPAAFVANPAVQQALMEKGEGVLPLLLVNGEIIREGAYASRKELAEWLGVNYFEPLPLLKPTRETGLNVTLKSPTSAKSSSGCCDGNDSNDGKCC